ncbi:hypothetical protein POM88_030406 [Heracleum sosnowskyi]|uniref:Uncharacterized protein n=1 Tax=Heracleum sosnowskyi TaxID=360622 RepID=A0AAD8HWE4_9APIA|nr:hypothetical protein POM88_030406 [Heracleum sosnowskyi]
MLEVYDLLDAFCEVIILNLPYIRKQQDCPTDDINEAASTLVFASARCGRLPELRKLRTLFGERYGHEFNMTALDLLPGNLVNFTVIENLSGRSVPNDAKNRILDEISSSLQVEPFPLEYTPEWQQQLEIPDNQSLTLTSLQESLKNTSKIIPENGIRVRHSGYEESDVHASRISKNEGNEEGNKSPSALNYPKIPFPVESYKEVGLFKGCTSEETVYLDDIEEFKYSICKDGDCIQDLSIFSFKVSNIPTERNSSYLRATSMPSERPKNVQSDSILRSSSFPLEHSTNHWSNAPRSPHVHPKLPEYDDIAEQFMALKEAAMQKKCMEERSNSFSFKHSNNHWNNAPLSPQVHPNLPEYDDIAVQFRAIKKAASQKKSEEGKKQCLRQISL